MIIIQTDNPPLNQKPQTAARCSEPNSGQQNPRKYISTLNSIEILNNPKPLMEVICRSDLTPSP